MRLISLNARNFRVLKAVDLRFSDQVVGIIGVNGAGKSSIVEAISWALYGNQAARSGKEEIKSTFARPDEDCEVSLEFLVNEEKYRVVRRLVGKSERAEVELYRGEAAESVGVSETKRYVGELLGLDWRGFLTSFLARQQELNALSTLQPARRKDHLAGMLGIERLDKAISQVKEDVKVAGGQAQVLERQVAEAEAVRQALGELEKRVVELEKAATQAEAERKKAEAAVKEVGEQFQKAQEKRSIWSEKSARLEAAEKTVADLTERREELTQEAAELKTAAAEAEKLAKEVTGLKAAKAELEKLREARGKQQWRNQLLQRVKELKEEGKSVGEAVKKSAGQLEEIRKKLKDVPAAVEAEAAQLRDKLAEARETYSEIQAERKSLEVQLEKLKTQMQSISELGPESVCDRCLRPLGDDLPEIRGHLRAEQEKLEADLAKHDELLVKAKEAGAKLREQSEAADKKVEVRRELIYEGQAADKEHKAAKERQESLEKQLADVSADLEKAGEVAFDPKRLEEVQKQVENLEEKQATLGRLEGRLARREQVAAGLAKSEKDLETARKQAEQLKEERAALKFSEEEFEKHRKEFEAAQAKADSVREESAAARREFDLVGKEIEGKKEQLKRLEAAAAELDDRRADQFYGEKLAGLLTEFRGTIISRIRPTLADFSSRFMSDMTGGRYTMVELDEKYNLRVLDDGQFFGVERFSGGEKDLANLCLRLAISQALIESAGMNRSFIILDEVFGSQDDERKELIIQGLTGLKHRFPQIFLITHVGDIKDRVERLIEVIPTGYGWSNVVVDGTPV